MSIELMMPSNHRTLCCPFSSCPLSFSASESFLRSWLFPSGGQSVGASISASVLSMNMQGWFPVGLTGLISLLSRGLSRIFSSTTIRRHQFFGAQPSLWSSSLIHMWLLEKPWLWLYSVHWVGCFYESDALFGVVLTCLIPATILWAWLSSQTSEITDPESQS